MKNHKPLKQTKDWVKKKLWLEDSRCHYCHCPLTISECTLDHKIPLAKGGTNSIFNLVLSCLKCNNEKADKDYKKYKRKKR